MLLRRSDLLVTAEYHLRRMWPDRNHDRVHTFANGQVHTSADVRTSIRQLIDMIRRQRARP